MLQALPAAGKVPDIVLRGLIITKHILTISISNTNICIVCFTTTTTTTKQTIIITIIIIIVIIDVITGRQ